MGRKPKPTALKIAGGNPGKRRLNRREPKRDGRMPSCPAWLDPEAKAEWRRIVPILVAQRVTSRVERASLAAYCIAWSRMKRAEKELLRDGITYKIGDLIKKHPAASIYHEAARELQSFASEFGLTPSSRSGVETGFLIDKPEDELSNFMETGS